MLHHILTRGGQHVSKKGPAVWVFSSLTFLSVAHLVESIYVLITGAPIRLLGIYPSFGQELGAISPTMYFWFSAAASLSFWAVTCVIAFENPMEQFLNMMLGDAKRQSVAESQMVADKCEVLDAMCETLELNNATIASIKDLVSNVRAEVRGIQPLAAAVDSVRTELADLAKEVEKLEGTMKRSYVCLGCGKPVLPEFKSCPYCGEDVKAVELPKLTVHGRQSRAASPSLP